MRPARYAVIKYIVDPARGEPLNVGIVAWNEDVFRLSIDSDAVARVIRENPKLTRDALYELAPTIEQRLSENKHQERTIEDFIADQRGYPVVLTEPQYTSTTSAAPEALETTLNRLLQRIVSPAHRRGGGGLSLIDLAERRLRPLVAGNHIARHHFLPASRTGVTRSVDFFANSGANLALDVLKLDLKKADEIRLRADAEAYKILDIASANDLSFLVLCDFSGDPELSQVNQSAQRILTSAAPDVSVLTDIDEAGNRMEQAAKHV